jgi:hypothetical protein
MTNKAIRANRFMVISFVAIVISLSTSDEIYASIRPEESMQTRISIKDTHWYFNGRITYPASQAEGLLMNVRMVNAVFEDRKRPDFDADKNADEFIYIIPDYVAHGIRAVIVFVYGDSNLLLDRSPAFW